MPCLARVDCTATGAQRDVAVPFDVISFGHIHVYRNGTEVDAADLSWGPTTMPSAGSPRRPPAARGRRARRTSGRPKA